ncbi:MAG: hypothetical protein K2K89_03445 [Ruminococcus sp.]|nr:hypothetical protein [Ruminococcus sp.]
MEKSNCEPKQIFLKDLPKEYYRLQFLADTGNDSIKMEMEISLKAGELVGKRKMFGKYLQRFPAMDVRKALIELFQVLDTPISDRDPYMNDDLSAFPYVNGGLFADENIEILRFIDEIVDLLVNGASKVFNWADISPTIFGAVFESTLNPDTRRSGGMHYTVRQEVA